MINSFPPTLNVIRNFLVFFFFYLFEFCVAALKVKPKQCRKEGRKLVKWFFPGAWRMCIWKSCRILKAAIIFLEALASGVVWLQDVSKWFPKPHFIFPEQGKNLIWRISFQIEFTLFCWTIVLVRPKNARHFHLVFHQSHICFICINLTYAVICLHTLYVFMAGCNGRAISCKIKIISVVIFHFIKGGGGGEEQQASISIHWPSWRFSPSSQYSVKWK